MNSVLEGPSLADSVEDVLTDGSSWSSTIHIDDDDAMFCRLTEEGGCFQNEEDRFAGAGRTADVDTTLTFCRLL